MHWTGINYYCAVPKNSHYTHLKKGQKKFQGGGGVLKAQFSNESMMLNWNFWRGERVQATV